MHPDPANNSSAIICNLRIVVTSVDITSVMLLVACVVDNVVTRDDGELTMRLLVSNGNTPDSVPTAGVTDDAG